MTVKEQKQEIAKNFNQLSQIMTSKAKDILKDISITYIIEEEDNTNAESGGLFNFFYKNKYLCLLSFEVLSSNELISILHILAKAQF